MEREYIEDKEIIEKNNLNKIQRLRKAIILLKSKDKKTKKGFKIPNKLKRIIKQKKKKPGYVVVQYLTKGYEIEFKLCKIVSGNLIVVDNKVHKLSPRKIWRLGKSSCYLIREIDRNPVSNDDYDNVKERKDDTESDVPLIKAVLGAIQKSNQSVINNKSTLIVIGVIAAIVIGAIIFMR